MGTISHSDIGTYSPKVYKTQNDIKLGFILRLAQTVANDTWFSPSLACQGPKFVQIHKEDIFIVNGSRNSLLKPMVNS